MIDAQTSIGCVTLNVANLDKVTGFYRDVVGLHVLAMTAERATLGTSTRALVHLQRLHKGRFSRNSCGLYHLALRVPSRMALARWFRHYVALDAPGWQGASDHGVSEALYLGDPEGNGIEVYRDRPQSKWEVNDDGSYALPTRRLDVRALLDEASASGGERGRLDDGVDMGHIHLRVSDIALAKQFYVALLGFGLKSEMRDSALFVAAGSYHHHIGLNNWHTKGGPPSAADLYGLAQFELCFATAAGRQQTLDQLAAGGYAINEREGVPLLVDPFQNHIALTIGG